MAESQLKTGKDFISVAKKSDKVRNIREGKGSHVIVEFEDGTSVSVPVHGNKQLGKGILSKLLKAFRNAGILIFIITLPLL